jgi:hypothetical protein
MEFGSNNLIMTIGQWSYLYILISILIHLAFSVTTFNDARHLKKSGEQLAVVGPVVWSFAVLVGGVFVALVYWVMHHSTLRR